MKKAMDKYYDKAMEVKRIDGSKPKSSSKLTVISFGNPYSVLGQPVAKKATVADADDDQEAENESEIAKEKERAQDAIKLARIMR
jgi:hypothetical protein